MSRETSTIDVTSAELGVLKILWREGESSIRDVAAVLYPRSDAAGYATVQKLLERLGEKRCVSRRRSGRLHLYQAVVDRKELITQRLQQTANQLCEGSWTPLLTQLLDRNGISPTELDELKAWLERHDQDERSGTRADETDRGEERRR